MMFTMTTLADACQQSSDTLNWLGQGAVLLAILIVGAILVWVVTR